MVKYVDYKYYQEKYKGTMPETSFERAVMACSAYLQKATFGRISESEIPENVKYACCAMCDVMHETGSAKIGGKTVKSESNDGYSVTFVTEADGQDPDTIMQSRLYRTARLYLDDGLFYLGIEGADYDNQC